MALFSVEFQVTHTFTQETTVVVEVEAATREEAYDLARKDDAIRDSADSWDCRHAETDVDGHEVTLIRGDEEDESIPKTPSHLLTKTAIMVMGAVA